MPANTDFNPVVVSPYHDEPAAMTGQELMAANPYRPWPARITSITELTATEKLFEFRLVDECIRNAFHHEPGQFVELSIFGVGEAPISISSSPSKSGFIELCVRRAGRFTEALALIKRENPLPAICGRVCNRRCEDACTRGRVDAAVAIDEVKKFIAQRDLDAATRYVPPVVTPTRAGGFDQKIAIIGGGPAGLSCAFYLAARGYKPTVFEKNERPGGMLVYGIPSFKLEKNVVDAEIEVMRELGVDIKCNMEVGKDISLDELRAQGYQAFYIAIGCQGSRKAGIPGEDADGVMSAVDFLHIVSGGNEDYRVDGRSVVIGGGNVAMDAARTALRLGAEVHIVYRRSEEELPARVEEVHHAKEEGIIFDLLTNPTEILSDDKGWVTGMKCIRMELGEPDESGRRRPVEVPGSEFVMELDTVIMSLGTSPNPLISSTTKGLDTNKWKCIIADENNGKTTKEGVYAGGDAVTGAATVILAMGAGKAAAKGIDEYLSAK